MPYEPGAFSASANPLKLREYLATGKPIVTIPMGEAERFAQFVEIAATKEEFLQKIEKALAEDSVSRRVERMAAVASMTWEARVAEVRKTLDTILALEQPKIPL
jgi:hypothetical protein